MIKNIFIIILLLIFIAVIVFLDVPGVQGILNLRKNAEVQKEEFLKQQELIARIEELTKAYEENKESVEKTEFILPSKEDIPNLIVQLESLAFGQGLLLEKIDFSTVKQETAAVIPVTEGSGSAKAAQNYQMLNVSIRSIGTYQALKNFLKSVEENMRLMDTRSINLSLESEEEFNIFNFDLTFYTYYQ